MKVLIRTDASVTIGSGHLMRCLTLADQLCSEGTEVAFVCRDLTGAMFELLQERGYRYLALPFCEVKNSPQSIDAKETIEAAKKLFPGGCDWLVVDHYALDATWERLLRSVARKIMVIDDLANRTHDCDLLLDQNFYRNMERRYQGLVPEKCRTLLGPEYVLFRPEFVAARKHLRHRDGTIRRILVFFGGSDPAAQTIVAIDALKLLNMPDIIIDIVVGSANPHQKNINRFVSQLPNATVHCQISNMAELIEKADLGIGAGGSSMWERCFLGLPTITVVFAANQERTTKDVASIGAIHYLGWSDNLEKEVYAQAIWWLINNPQKLNKIRDAALNIFPTAGVSVSKILLDFE